MTLDESMTGDGLALTAEVVRAEIEAHHVSWAEFIAEHGDKPTYNSRDVLIWLGY